MNIAGAIAAYLAFAALTTASMAQSRDETLLDRVTGYVGNATYRIDITEDSDLARAALPRHVAIRCIDGCATPVSYHEDLSEMPISAFRLWDGTSRFVTIWATGAAYLVMIYDVSPKGVRKVMQQGTRGWPQFVYLPNGSEGVILQEMGDGPWTDHQMPLRPVLWKWDGQHYVAAPGEKH